MRHSFLSPLLLLGGLAVPAIAQAPPGLENIKDGEMSKRLIHYWADFKCMEFSDHSEAGPKEQCKKACLEFENTPSPGKFVGHSQTCVYDSTMESWFNSGKVLTPEERKQPLPRKSLTVTPGLCKCDDPLITFAGDFFIQGVIETGKILNKFMCPTLIALDLVVEVGSAAIPGVGKAITTGIKMGVKTAKMFKNSYDAAEAAMEWASMFVDVGFGLASEAGCKTPFKFSKADLAKKFLDFANAPDGLIPEGINYDELPCPKGKKASKKCKDKNGEGDDDKKPPTETKKDDQPKATDNFKPSATATANCNAIANKLEGAAPAKRAVDTLHSRRIEKRAPKDGVACIKLAGEWKISSWSYPSNPHNPDSKSAKELGFDSTAYGWTNPKTCDDFRWGGARFNPENKYDTEHILEWSVITNFFTTMDGQYKKDEFTHPDPDQKGKKVNFCTYWHDSWNFEDPVKTNPNQKIGNPAPQVGAQTKFKELMPIEWLAAHYPYKTKDGDDYLHEMTLLQKAINAPAKSMMFDPDRQIYDADTMKKMIKRTNKPDPIPDQPREAIQRIRSVIGAFKYMQEDEIKKIFVAEKTRIGAVLDGLDKSLPSHPRVIGTKKFTPWKTLGMGAKWNKYMDDVFENAKKKGAKFVDDNIKLLKDEYQSTDAKNRAKDNDKKSQKERNEIKEWAKLRQDIDDMIPKLEQAWKDAKDWKKPW